MEKEITATNCFSVKELWDLQEKLFDDPKLPEYLKAIETFPKEPVISRPHHKHVFMT